MGRRSDHTREALRKLALDAAQHIIEEEGWRALTARKITGNIGYTVGTLYNHFKNLDDVIIHVNGRTLSALHYFLSETLKNPAARGKEIHTLAEAYLEFSHSHYSLWAMLFEHHLPEGEVLPEWYNQKVKALFLLVEDAVRPLFGRDEATVARTAKVLWAGLHGICALSLSGKLETTGAEPVKLLAQSFIDGYIKGVTQG